jgi:hypothetical protein
MLAYKKASQSTYIFRTISGCSVLCLENQDFCSAFQYKRNVCSLGRAETLIPVPENANPYSSVKVWREDDISTSTNILISI